MSRDEIQIRRELERELGGPLGHDAWRMLCDEFYVKEVLDGVLPLPELTERVRKLQRSFGGENSAVEASPAFLGSRRQKRGKSVPSRQEAISLLAAQLARTRRDVCEFRRAVLGNKVIAWKDISTWLESHKAASNLHIVVKCPAGIRALYREGRWRLHPWPTDPEIELLSLGTLLYVTPDLDGTKSVPVGGDGPLRELLVISHILSKEYGWDPAQATVFLLTDCVPVVSLCRISTSFNPECPSLSRIMISVDPITTPRELAAKYGELRTQVFNATTGTVRTRRKRVRSISEKHARLAAFSVQNVPLDRQKMSVWNRLYPAWWYARYSIFSRDAKTAGARLLGRANSSVETQKVESQKYVRAGEWASVPPLQRESGQSLKDDAEKGGMRGSTSRVEKKTRGGK